MPDFERMTYLPDAPRNTGAWIDATLSVACVEKGVAFGASDFLQLPMAMVNSKADTGNSILTFII